MKVDAAVAAYMNMYALKSPMLLYNGVPVKSTVVILGRREAAICCWEP